MSALTVRLADDKHARLRALAQSRGTTLNRLIDEMTTMMLVEHDAEVRFRLRAAKGEGKAARGLALLKKATRARCVGWMREALSTTSVCAR
jgi:predicted transcriptional regulator